ncbi:unnamed protein product [Scytosiphon promiscuus]
MVQQEQQQHLPRRRRAPQTPCSRRRGRRLFCLLSLLCAVGGQAIYVESDPSAKEPGYCTLFHHQVKSAGTTIKDKLEMASMEAGLGKPGLCVTGPGYEQSCLESFNGSMPVIAGYVELLRDTVEKSGRECDFFTILRNPIDRLVSAFFYCPSEDVQARPRKWCGNLEQEPDAAPIEMRLLEFAQRDWRNKAFRQMSYSKFCPPKAFCQRMDGIYQNVNNPGVMGMLAEFEDNLATYTAVGILEYWDLSMELFNARIKSPVKDWKATPEHLRHLGVHKANVGISSEVRTQVSQWAHMSPALHATVATDMLLYQYAVSVFMQQTQESLGTQWR